MQEFLENSRIVTGAFAFALNGNIKSKYFHQRIYTYPSQGGVTVFSKIVHEIKDLDKTFESIVNKLKWNGLIMIEFIKSENNYKLIEINPRIWGSILGSSSAKINVLQDYINSFDLINISIKSKKKDYIFWVFPYGIFYLFALRIFKSLFEKNLLIINFTNSSFFSSIFFHLVIYARKIFK